MKTLIAFLLISPAFAQHPKAKPASRLEKLRAELQVEREQNTILRAQLAAKGENDSDCAATIARMGKKTIQYHRALIRQGAKTSDPIFQ